MRYHWRYHIRVSSVAKIVAAMRAKAYQVRQVLAAVERQEGES
jgi:orotate phosphoribosyltransferase